MSLSGSRTSDIRPQFLNNNKRGYTSPFRPSLPNRGYYHITHSCNNLDSAEDYQTSINYRDLSQLCKNRDYL
jgi:hypothetical protein